MNQIAVMTAIGFLLASSAAAIDGATEINSARAAAGGVTPGDAPGFPVTISAPGSFILTGSITAPSNGLPLLTVAISQPAVPGHHVAIDLHGFVLNNAANVGTPGAAVIMFTGSVPQEVTIRNGTLIGGFDGFRAVGGARKVVLEEVQIGNSGANGAHLSDVENIVIRRCVITMSGGNGILIDTPGGVSLQGTIEETLIKGTILSGMVVAANPTGRGTILLKKNQLDEIGTAGLIPGPYFGAISLLEAEPCLLSENTIRGVGGMGIFGVKLEGCQFIDNVVSDTASDGIHLDSGSEDSFLIHNTVRGSPTDAIHIAGHKNNIEANVMHSTAPAPGAAGFGLHFVTGSTGNHYGRNSAVGNVGGPCAFPVSANFCDDNGPAGTNYSFGDNMMPGPAKF
jgi:hypothetical protein